MKAVEVTDIVKTIPDDVEEQEKVLQVCIFSATVTCSGNSDLYDTIIAHSGNTISLVLPYIALVASSIRAHSHLILISTMIE